MHTHTLTHTHTNTHTHHNSEDVDKLLWTPSKINKGWNMLSAQSAMLGARCIQGPGNQLSSVLSHRPDKPGNTWLTYNGYTQSCNCFPLHALVVVTKIHAGGQVAYNRSIGLEHPCHHSTPPTQSVNLHRVTWVIHMTT